MNNTGISTSRVIPTEEEECIALVEFLERSKIKYSHLAQSTYSTSWPVKMRNKRMGVKRGVPDYLIILPESAGLLFIEMKRKNRGRVSPEQKEWLKSLNMLNGVEATVAYGADEAIAIIDQLSSI